MRLRLERRGRHDREVIERVIELFLAQGLLNDAQFARVVANNLQSRAYGRRRAELELRKKGLKGQEVAEALEVFDPESQALAARDLAARRLERMKGLGLEQKKRRLFGFLRRRGFEPAAIFAVFTDLFKENEGLE